MDESYLHLLGEAAVRLFMVLNAACGYHEHSVASLISTKSAGGHMESVLLSC